MKGSAGCFAFIALWLASALALAEPAVSPSLRIGFTTVDSYPYFSGSGEEIPEPPGMAVELARDAARRAGLRLTLVRLPQHRIFLELQKGGLDGAMVFSYLPERALDNVYPWRDGVPYRDWRIGTLTYVLYKRSDSPLTWDGQAFGGLHGKIGYNTGWSIGRDLEKYGVPLEEAHSTEQNFGKLVLGRIAGFALMRELGDAYIARTGLRDIERLPAPLAVKDYFVIFSKGFYQANTGLVEAFWAHLGEAREENEARLWERYAE
ncbi:ABC transporter substrate-binding protein [Pseudomonas sp.]|uniref:substrate-binding periplasmic protein n=1 Tax=Pseudomonas sp. TaxID=306 RepID=UPI0027346B64|nr:transporter substrate-binding domain-containing protein [Pseudomonas sp.]MDP3815524.1 hypothetical protein [Pseudomonas sp.]